jgi:hypothetical protein
MRTSQKIKRSFKPGQIYRSGDLSPAIRRHLSRLVSEETLQRISRGLYYCPEKSAFGSVPPDDQKMIRAFLKRGRFLLISLNSYNALGVGTTQLYNEQRVYNYKRRGKIKLGGRTFYFFKKKVFPKIISPEFLLVDLINNIDDLAEDRSKILERAKQKASLMDRKKLRRAVKAYASIKAQKFLKSCSQEFLTK